MDRTSPIGSTNFWQQARALLIGPLLAGGAIASIELADSVGIKVPNPPSLLVMIVVFSAFSGGLRSGLLCHVIACTYFGVYYSVPEQPFHYVEGNLLRVFAYAVTTPVMIVMASRVKRRADRLAEQSLQKEREHSASLLALLEERRKTEEKLHLAMEAAEAASRAKTEFLANVSHEVRTPMNGIIGLTLLTLETDLTREQRENLEMVKASADSLLMVINDILDFSKVEAGRLDLDRVEIDMSDVVAEATKALALRAHEKGLELGYRIGPGVPAGLLGDPLRLRQVLINLVGNAIKFTDHGEVFVWVDGREVAGSVPASPQVELHFQVRDTGMGIPKDKQRMIFEAFAQADGSMKRKYEGTGLGLTISSRLVELMDGRLWVESEVGEGSVFHFTARLPLAATETVTPELPRGVRGARVLVVDDNGTSGGILAELLEGWGFQPTWVDSGAPALEAAAAAEARGAPFQLFLVDAGMPAMDGFALAHALHERGSRAPVVMMLTTAGRRGARTNDRGLQIAAYVTKPLKTGDLLTALLRALGADREGSDANRGTDRELRAPRRREGLRLLLAEDNLVNQRLMMRLLEKAGHAATIVRTGREALEALAKEPFDMVLMDVQMPEMDGFETTAAIRAGERISGKHLPLLALTAHAMRGDRERCLEAGFDGYVSKPIRFQDLFDAIDELAPPEPEPSPSREPPPAGHAVLGALPAPPHANGAARASDGLPLPPPSDSQGGERLAAFAEEAALESTGGDRGLLQELIGIFLTEAPVWMRDLEGALRRGDAAEVHRIAHTIKGAVDSCGAARAYDAAMLLERMARGGELEGAPAALATLGRELARLRPELAAYADRNRGRLMPVVLVVDDSPVDRARAGGLLKKAADLTPIYAANGREALEAIREHKPDIVVTDLQMPEIDGLELTATIRREIPALPVILMTAHGSEETAIAALRRGATNYVAKRKLASELVPTVLAVLDIARADRGQREILGCLTQTESRYELDNDVRHIPALLDELEASLTRMGLFDRTEWMRIGVALREALVNAIYHGNLELTSTLLEEDEGKFARLAEERPRDPVFGRRRVHVLARETKTEAMYVIRDEGGGFDPACLPDPTDLANLDRRTGRGLFLIRTFMDEVRHNADGNEITLLKRREARD